MPTTYVAPRAYPMRTNQYSVTNYKRTFEHGQATPGIFFKFDIDPMQLTVLQRTTTFTQLAHLGNASSPRSDVMKTRLTIRRISRASVCNGFCQYSFGLSTCQRSANVRKETNAQLRGDEDNGLEGHARARVSGEVVPRKRFLVVLKRRLVEVLVLLI